MARYSDTTLFVVVYLTANYKNFLFNHFYWWSAHWQEPG